MAKQVSITLEKEHIRIVRQYGKELGITKFSTALQSLIKQFDKQNQPDASKNGNGQSQPAAEVPAPAGA